jgi:hypothetical protein
MHTTHTTHTMHTAHFERPTFGQLTAATLAMAAVVLASNILVQFAINDWLTWGAFTYPVAYLVSWRRRASRRLRGWPSSPRSCSTSACSTGCAAASGGARRWWPP